MARVAEHGGAVEAVPYMKAALVESHRERIARIESRRAGAGRRQPLHETEPSPLTADAEGGILVVDPAVEAEARERAREWRARATRPRSTPRSRSCAAWRRPTRTSWRRRSPPPAPARRPASGRRRCATRSAPTARRPASARPPRRPPTRSVAELRDEVGRVGEALGRTLKILVGKPGLDGHSNGAEQIAVRARDAGMDVVYEGIRLTPAQIARSAVDEGVHVIGLSILSGSHRELIPDVIEALREAGGGDIPVVVGGIIPEADVAAAASAAGVAAVYTPKDFELTRIMRDVVALVAERNGVAAAA